MTVGHTTRRRGRSLQGQEWMQRSREEARLGRRRQTRPPPADLPPLLAVLGLSLGL